MNFVAVSDGHAMSMNQSVKSGYLYGFVEGFAFIARPEIVESRGMIPLIWWNYFDSQWHNDSISLTVRREELNRKLPPAGIKELNNLCTLKSVSEIIVKPLCEIQRFLRNEWKQGRIELTSKLKGVKPFLIPEMKPISKPIHKVKLDGRALYYEARNPSANRVFHSKASCSRLPSMNRDYEKLSKKLYGSEIEMNGRTFRVEKKICEYLDGNGYSNCKNAIGNDSYRVPETVFPVKSGKRN